MFKTKKVRVLENEVISLNNLLNDLIHKQTNDTKALENLKRLVKLEVIGIAPSIQQFYILSIKCNDICIQVDISKEQKEIFMKALNQLDIYKYIGEK